MDNTYENTRYITRGDEQSTDIEPLLQQQIPPSEPLINDNKTNHKSLDMSE